MADPNEVGGQGWVIDPTNPNRATYKDENGDVYETFKDVAPSQTSEQPQQPRGGWERFTDSIAQSAQEGFGGQVAQAWYDMTDAMKPELRQRFPGRSDDWYEQMSDRVISESRKAVINEYAAKQAEDPNWKPDESFLSAVATPSKWVPWLAGQLVGGAGPESLINPGGSALARIGSQTAIGGATDVGYQGLNMAEDVRDEYSVEQTLGAAAAGGGLQGVFEIPGFVKNLFQGRGVDTTPGKDPLNGPEGKAIAEPLDVSVGDTGVLDPRQYSLNELAKIEQSGEWAIDPKDGLYHRVEADPVLASARQQGEELFNKPVAPEIAEPKIARGAAINDKVETAKIQIAELTRDWENGPQFDVITSTKDLPKELKGVMPDDAIGAYLPDGRVIVNLKNAKTPEAVSAVVFHEGLGHHGLAQKFNDDLDRVLEDLYDNAKGDFRQNVDDWMVNNPQAYGGNLARAAEEVLAEMSEAGQITPSMMGRIRNWLKDFGRQMGLDLKYSDGEIKTILGMAHAATVKGTPSAGSNGFRLKAATETPTYRNSEGRALIEYSQAQNMRPSEAYKQYVNGDEQFRGQIDARIKELEAIERAREASASARATRYKTEEPTLTRREKSQAATQRLADIEPGKTKTTQPFPDEEPDYWRFRHVTEDGKEITGHYNIEDGALVDFNINSKAGPGSFGPRTVRAIGRSLLKEHPEARRISGYRISGARIKGAGKSPFDAEFVESGAKFSRKLQDRTIEMGKEPIGSKGSSEFEQARDKKILRELGVDSFTSSQIRNTDISQYPQALLDEADNLSVAQIESIMDRLHNGEKVNLDEELRRSRAKVDNSFTKSRKARPQMPRLEQGPTDSQRAAYFRKMADYHDARRILSMKKGDTRKAAYHQEQVDSYRRSASRYAGSALSSPRLRDSQEVKFSRKTDENGEELKVRVGALNPNKIKTVADIDEHLYELEAVNPKSGRKTWAETEAEAQARGLTPSRIAKRRGAEGLSSYLRAANQALTDQLEKVASLETKLNTEGYSVKRHEELLKAITTLKAVHARVNYDNSEVGRALNILRKATESKDKVKLFESVDLDLLSDPDQFMKFMAQFNQQLANGNTNGAIRMISDAFRPKAEDFIFAAWYNMMLSSPATHAANFAGTGMNFMYDLLENTGAAVTGQFKRFSNADRVRAREVMYRMYGAISALKTASTWTNARESLNTGLTGNQTNTKGGSRGTDTGAISSALGNKAGKLGEAVGGFIETPSRLLAGTDEWWRGVIQLSNIYGLAVRNAGNKGLKGKDFWNEVNELIARPTKEMLEATGDYTKVIQFLDKPSGLAKGLINWQTPKIGDRPETRVGRAVLRTLFPFVRTPDALIRTSIRRGLGGPLSYLERENIKGWKAGGAERDKVKARLIMGSALSFYVAAQAYKGNISGEGPSDYRKRSEWEGSHQPNSIKIGDKWVSIAGLEPVSTNINGIATLVERYKAGEISEDDYLSSALSLAQGMGAVLSQNSYTENLSVLPEIFSGDKNQAMNTLQNFVANISSSATTPAIVRKYNQTYKDKSERDTTGDGSPEERIAGRIMSGFPGLSRQLPAKYDVYGREQTREGYAGPDIASRMETRMEENDPVVKELARLAETTPKVIIGRPSKNGVKVNGETRKLTAEEFQDYQHLSGYWIVEAVRQQMETPEWKSMNDVEKIDLLKELRDEVRKAARETLFDPEDEQTDDEVEGDL